MYLLATHEEIKSHEIIIAIYFQIKNEEAQKHWQASRLEEDAAEHFRFGGEYREMDLYLLKRGVLNF